MPNEGLALAVILGMAVATYASRIGGLWIMTRVPLTGRVSAFLNALSGSVLVALVAPAALHGDTAAKLALAVTLGVMALTRRAMLALGLGMAAAVLYRAAG